jgi:acetate kinase
MAWAGIEIDRDANRRGDETISTVASRVVVRVIATDEEAMIAHHTARTAAASALSRTPED